MDMHKGILGGQMWQSVGVRTLKGEEQRAILWGGDKIVWLKPEEFAALLSTEV